MSIQLRRRIKCPNCGCGGSGCPNTTGCTGPNVLANCAGYKFVLAEVTSANGSFDRTYSFADDYTYPLDMITLTPNGGGGNTLTILAGNGTPFGPSMYQPFGTLSFDASLSASISPFEPTIHAIGGYYRRITINGETTTFDATAGCGVSLTFSTSNRAQQAGSGGGFRFDGTPGPNNRSISGSVSVTLERTHYERIEYTIGPASDYDPIGASWGIRLRFDRKITTRNSYQWTITGGSSDFTEDYDFIQTSEQAFRTNVSGLGDETYFAIGLGGSGATCSGSLTESNTYNTSGFYDDYWGGWNYLPSLNGETPISGYGFQFSNIGGTTGSTTVEIADSFEEVNVGCRRCHRVLDLSGTVTDQLYEDGTFDPEEGEFPELGNGVSIGSAAITGRLVQSGVDECGVYGCQWGGDVTVALPGIDPYEATAVLEKIGPSWWRLFISGVTGPFPSDAFYLTFPGDCPSGAATVGQGPNPHSYRVEGVGPKTPLECSCQLDDVSITEFDVTYEVEDGYSGTFTGHAFTFTPADPEEGDPLWVCDDPCNSDWTSYPETLTASLVIDGTPTVIDLTRIGTNPGAYQGFLGSYMLTVAYDGMVATLAQLLDFTVSDEIPISTWKRYCASDGQGPIGTYFAASLTPNTLTVTT